MRGKVDGGFLGGCGLGITPAYAGKRHGCAHTPHNAAGSPPRMRGKAKDSKAVLKVYGITPAYAGKSVLCRNTVF